MGNLKLYCTGMNSEFQTTSKSISGFTTYKRIFFTHLEQLNLIDLYILPYELKCLFKVLTSY